MDLVDIPYKVTNEEALKAFVNENPSLGLSFKADDACAADVPGNPDMYISVVGVKKCYETKQYRVLFRTTELLIDTIDGWKMKLHVLLKNTFFRTPYNVTTVVALVISQRNASLPLFVPNVHQQNTKPGNALQKHTSVLTALAKTLH